MEWDGRHPPRDENKIRGAGGRWEEERMKQWNMKEWQGQKYLQPGFHPSSPFSALSPLRFAMHSRRSWIFYTHSSPDLTHCSMLHNSPSAGLHTHTVLKHDTFSSAQIKQQHKMFRLNHQSAWGFRSWTSCVWPYRDTWTWAGLSLNFLGININRNKEWGWTEKKREKDRLFSFPYAWSFLGSVKTCSLHLGLF